MRIPANRSEAGASLIMVLMILIVVSVLGVGSAQLALMGERSARNDRDQQLAFQSAETGLYDATNDIEGAGGGTRGALFGNSSVLNFVTGCGTSGQSLGLCAPAAVGAKPAWLAVDFLGTPVSYAKFGDFTGASFDAGTVGIQPAAAPRYVIEPVPIYDVGQNLSKTPGIAYRVTAIGFGPRTNIQGVVQMLYRKQ